MGSLSGTRRIAGIWVGALLLLLTAGAIGETAVTGGSKAAGLDTCVAPTAEIRRNHMDYLKHDRDKTVHLGVRTTQYSLADCVGCHAEKRDAGSYEPINSEGQFCAGCHNYVAVNITCFQCHRTTPETDGAAGTALQSDLKSLARLRSQTAPVSLGSDELKRLHATITGD